MNRMLNLTAAFWIVSATMAQAQPQTLAVAAADQKKFGIGVVTLAETEIAATTEAFVHVLDIGALAALDADLATADAAAGASLRESERRARLAAKDQGASKQSVEAASAQSVADSARAQLLSRRLALEWSPALAAMSAQEREDLIAAVSSGEAALVRADAISTASSSDATVVVDVGAASVAVQTIGAAGMADARLQSVGVIALVRGPDAARLRPGGVFAGSVSTASKTKGVVIPRSAIIRLDGDDWAYVKSGAETFERREIVEPDRRAEGWFVAKGFSAGETVVANGAGSLLAIERADESAEAN